MSRNSYGVGASNIKPAYAAFGSFNIARAVDGLSLIFSPLGLDSESSSSLIVSKLLSPFFYRYRFVFLNMDSTFANYSAGSYLGAFNDASMISCTLFFFL